MPLVLSDSHVVILFETGFENVTSAELIENETRRVKPADWLIHKRSSNGTNIQTSILFWLFVEEDTCVCWFKFLLYFFRLW